MIVINTIDKSVAYRSHGGLHGGYLGLIQSYETISINGYNPKSHVSRIKVIPGTQTNDLPIMVGPWPLRSKSLVLTPKSNSNYPDYGSLSFSSDFSNFKIFQGESLINFRIGATSNTIKGVYYIDWTPNELVQEGVDGDLYSTPVSIMVEVCEVKEKSVIISVSNIPKLYTGSTSIPIKVSLGNAPATDITDRKSVV